MDFRVGGETLPLRFCVSAGIRSGHGRLPWFSIGSKETPERNWTSTPRPDFNTLGSILGGPHLGKVPYLSIYIYIYIDIGIMEKDMEIIGIIGLI